MTDRTRNLRNCPSAYDCRDQLPELAAWMSDDDLKQITIWRGPRFEEGRMISTWIVPSAARSSPAVRSSHRRIGPTSPSPTYRRRSGPS